MSGIIIFVYDNCCVMPFVLCAAHTPAATHTERSVQFCSVNCPMFILLKQFGHSAFCGTSRAEEHYI